MGKFYKLFTASRTAFYVIGLFLVTLFCAGLPASASSDPVFTIPAVKVDVTADNAAAAREQAFAQAQTVAFTKLAERIMSDNQLKTFKAPPPSVISPMIKDFEVTEEHISSVRYIGTYTFRFKKDDVRNYLGGQGVAYTDVSSKPVLILPFYRPGAQTILWSKPNPWLDAWNNAQSVNSGLVPIVIPIGDLQDVSDIGDNDALTYQPEKLFDMTERYAAGEAIVLLAIPQWTDAANAGPDTAPDSLVIMVYRTDRGSPEFANKLVVTKDDVQPGSDIFATAMNLSRSTMQKAWKNQTLVNASQNNKLKARVQFSTMQEWIETQKKLRGVQGVNNVKLLSLTQGEANIELAFQGTEQRLRLALSQADMTLNSPTVDFNNSGTPYQPQQYGQYQYGQTRSSPLVYDLYLNKYRHY